MKKYIILGLDPEQDFLIPHKEYIQHHDPKGMTITLKFEILISWKIKAVGDALVPYSIHKYNSSLPIEQRRITHCFPDPVNANSYFCIEAIGLGNLFSWILE